MPVYEYRCKGCGRTHEIEHGFHDERPTRCPSCGAELVRVFHPVGVVFKGSGFYKTDSSRGESAAPAPSPTGTDAKSEGTTSGAKAGDATKAAEAKPSGEKPSGKKPGGEKKGGDKST